MTKPSLLLAALALVMSAGTALAGSGEQRREFYVLDENGDDRIDREEAESHPLLPMYFDQLDADGSGRIELSEWDMAYVFLKSLSPGGPSI